MLLGAASPWSAERVLDYCDGWLPGDGGGDLEAQVADLRRAAERAGRDLSELDLMLAAGNPIAPDRDRIRHFIELGFDGILLFVHPVHADDQWKQLESYAELLEEVRPVSAQH